MSAPSRSGIEAVCFDLDGTLVDSRPGIEASLRAALAEVLPERSLGPGEPLIGPPLETILARLLPDAPAAQKAVAAAFRRHYDSDGWRQASTYPGIVEALDVLAAAGLALHIATNKRAAPTRLITGAPPLDRRFQLVVSPDSVAPPHATKADALCALVAASGLEPASFAYVGDSEEDGKAAAAAGCAFVAVEWGYGPLGRSSQPTQLGVAATPRELTTLLLTGTDRI